MASAVLHFSLADVTGLNRRLRQRALSSTDGGADGETSGSGILIQRLETQQYPRALWNLSGVPQHLHVCLPSQMAVKARSPEERAILHV